MPHLKLFYNPISPPCRFLLMLAKELNLNMEMEKVNILSKSGLRNLPQVCPQPTVPLLKDDDFYVWESHAIGPYLVEKYANDDRLYPKDVRRRALVDQKLHFDCGVLFPTLHRTIYPILFRNQLGIALPDISRINSCYCFVNKFVENSKWLCGDNMTLADLCCLSTLTTLDLIYPAEHKKFLKLISYMQRFEETNLYKEQNLPGLQQLVKEIQTRFNLHKVL